jgi:purine-binding chemotaxis protein CheW
MPAEAIQNKVNSESANQYLTFLLNGEEYGVEILNVQEIKSWGPFTPLPRSPEHVLGVINLRGAIVPIVDLRARLGLPTKEMTSTTAIIIISVDYEQQVRTVGLVVDQVSEVYQLLPENIQASGDVNRPIDQEGYIKAFGHIDEKLLILINLDPIIASTVDSSPDIEL